jgi:hypothetical protein
MADSAQKLTNRQILSLAEGFASLDGMMDGGKIVRFKFEAETAWHIALDSEAVGRAKAVYERALKKLAAQLGIVEGQGVTQANAAAVAAYIDARETLLDQEQDMGGLHTYERSELQRAGAIPPSVLAHLLPVLEDR